MGSIYDTLTLRQDEIDILHGKHPHWMLFNQVTPCHLFQNCRMVIPRQEEDTYFKFLLENCIALSSTNFLRRIESDKEFAERMQARLADALRDF